MPPITQQSTGQAGVEVNRDLEVLFQAVNQLARCTRRISEFLDGGSTGGGFGGGGGSTVPPNPPVPNPPSPPVPEPPIPPEFLTVATADNFTLPEEFSGDVFINPSDDIVVTLGTPRYGARIRVFHVGTTKTITINTPAAATIDVLEAAQMLEPIVFPTAGGTPEYVTGAVVVGKSGAVYTSHVLVFRNADAGLVQKDQTDGEFYRLELNSGAGAYDSEGAAEPDI